MMHDALNGPQEHRTKYTVTSVDFCNVAETLVCQQMCLSHLLKAQPVFGGDKALIMG